MERLLQNSERATPLQSYFGFSGFSHWRWKNVILFLFTWCFFSLTCAPHQTFLHRTRFLHESAICMEMMSAEISLLPFFVFRFFLVLQEERGRGKVENSTRNVLWKCWPRRNEKKKKTGKEKEKNFRGFSSSFFWKKRKLFFERKLLRAGLSIACSFTNGNDTDRRVLHTSVQSRPSRNVNIHISLVSFPSPSFFSSFLLLLLQLWRNWK